MKTNLLLSAIGFGTLLTSCSALYAPSTPHLPMMTKKGTTELNISAGMGGSTGTMDLNFAHAATNHLGLMFNYNNFQGYDDNGGQHSLDVGAGYFTTIDEDWGFEVYSTLGYGVNNAYKASSVRYAIQPDIFYSGKHVDFGFGFRLHYLKYDFKTTSYNWAAAPGLGDMGDEAIGQTAHVMFEPTIKFAVGGEKVKASFQATCTTKLNRGYIDADPCIFSFGVTVKIPSLKKP